MPRSVGALLDLMPPELLKTLPPRRIINHKLPTYAPYQMSPLELAKLRKQLGELLEVRYIQPSKVPYDALVLF